MPRLLVSLGGKSLLARVLAIPELGKVATITVKVSLYILSFANNGMKVIALLGTDVKCSMCACCVLK